MKCMCEDGYRTDIKEGRTTARRETWFGSSASQLVTAHARSRLCVCLPIIRAEEPCGEISASPKTTGEARAIQDAPSQLGHYREGLHQLRLGSPDTNNRIFAPSGPDTVAGCSHG